MREWLTIDDVAIQALEEKFASDSTVQNLVRWTVGEGEDNMNTAKGLYQDRITWMGNGNLRVYCTELMRMSF